MEVLFAITLFAVGAFAILELTSRNLRNARSLQRIPIDIAALASDLSLTNALEEGWETGDFGDLYPGATWQRDVVLYSSNGLYEVNFVVNWELEGRPQESELRLLLYRGGAGSLIRSGAGTRGTVRP
jgi:hypothetical protein